MAKKRITTTSWNYNSIRIKSDEEIKELLCKSANAYSLICDKDVMFEYEKGRDYSELRHALADLAAKSLDNAPTVNTDVLTNYDQMKDLCFIR